MCVFLEALPKISVLFIILYYDDSCERGWWRVNKVPLLSIFMDFVYLFICWFFVVSNPWSGRTGDLCASVFTYSSPYVVLY